MGYSFALFLGKSVATTTSKIDKKDLKTPDEFLSWGSRAANYVAANSVMVIGATLLVLVAIAGLFGWLHAQKEREVEAAGKLFEGEKILAGGGGLFGVQLPGMVKDEDKKKAIEVFERVAREYEGTNTGRRARLLAGDTQLQLGEHDAALASYEAALSGAGAVEEFYARNGIAHAHEAKGSLDAAASAYRQIVDDESLSMRDVAALDLARVLRRNGKTDEARDLLSGFATKFPESVLKSDAEKELLKVGGTISTPTPPEAAPGGEETSGG